MTSHRVPGATYRLQFNRNFKFAAAEVLVPYLHELGVNRHLCLSPSPGQPGKPPRVLGNQPHGV
jgi:hypothetical protein